MNWGRVCYITGVGFVVVAFGWWLVTLFKLFAEFYKYDGLKLLVLPLFKLFTNPLLWIGILLIKLAGRASPQVEKSPSSPEANS